MTATKRIALGLAASIGILTVFDLLPNPIPGSLFSYRLFDHYYVWSGVGGMIAIFFASLGGAYVSKTRYVIPAILLSVVLWMFVVYFLNSIAAEAGQADILSVASSNLPGLLFGFVGAATGACVGARLVKRNAGRDNVVAS